MPHFKLDREPYLQILESQGASAALTQLQKDAMQWEYAVFEGPEGYQAKNWKDLEEVREFSRELWEKEVEAERKRLEVR